MSRFADLTRRLAGLGAVLSGGVILASSANLSFQGYSASFDLVGAGFIGVGISALGFFATGGIRLLWSDDLRSCAIVAGFLAVVCWCGDIYGNDLAMGGEIEAEREAALELQAAYDAAAAALPRRERDLASSIEDRGIVAGDDILAAQRLLKARGYYDGRIDGKAGGKTQSAMDAFAADQKPLIDDLRAKVEALNTIVAAGRPDAPESRERLMALIVAAALASLPYGASFFGWPLMLGRPEDVEAALAETEEQVAALEQDLDSALSFTFSGLREEYARQVFERGDRAA